MKLKSRRKSEESVGELLASILLIQTVGELEPGLRGGEGYILLGPLYHTTRISYYTFAQKKKERFVNNRNSREILLPNAAVATLHFTLYTLFPFSWFLVLFIYFLAPLISVVSTLYFLPVWYYQSPR